MLIRFKVSNYRSILKEQELCLFPSGVRSFKDHIYQTSSNALPGLLKSALIWGANSSGKSNMVKAIAFSKNLIVSSRKNMLLNVPIFKLSADPTDETKFSYEILINDTCYTYTFIISEGIIKSERLETSTKYRESILFTRTTEGEKVNVDFKLNFKNNEEDNFHKTISRGTRTNQLFLNFINEQNPDAINKILIDVFLWFKNKLTIIFPDSKAKGIEIKLFKDKNLWDFYNNCLNYLDTGIDKLDFDSFGFDDAKFQIPDFIKEDIRQKVQDENTIYTVSQTNNDTYYVQKVEGKLTVKKIKAAHEIKSKGELVKFDFSVESDGTNRIMDLIPMLYLLEHGNTVIIDEIDRSFHSLISEKLFIIFFKKTFGIPSQLIATTHDLTLLDLDKFRRDEIWFIKKDNDNQSILYSLDEFKPRFDKRLRKAYLEGRYGAIPLLTEIMENANAF
jgi:AAA15 family ATPase/GTPase